MRSSCLLPIVNPIDLAAYTFVVFFTTALYTMTTHLDEVCEGEITTFLPKIVQNRDEDLHIPQRDGVLFKHDDSPCDTPDPLS